MSRSGGRFPMILAAMLLVATGCTRACGPDEITRRCDRPLLERGGTDPVSALKDPIGTVYDRLTASSRSVAPERVKELVRDVNASFGIAPDAANYRIEGLEPSSYFRIECDGCGLSTADGHPDAALRAQRSISCFVRRAVAEGILPASFSAARVQLSPADSASSEADSSEWIIHPPWAVWVKVVALHRGVPIAGSTVDAFVTASGALHSVTLPNEARSFVATEPSIKRIRSGEEILQRFPKDVAREIPRGQPHIGVNRVMYRPDPDGTYAPVQVLHFSMSSGFLMQRGGQELVYRLDSTSGPELRR